MGRGGKRKIRKGKTEGRKRDAEGPKRKRGEKIKKVGRNRGMDENKRSKGRYKV